MFAFCNGVITGWCVPSKSLELLLLCFTARVEDEGEGVKGEDCGRQVKEVGGSGLSVGGPVVVILPSRFTLGSFLSIFASPSGVSRSPFRCDRQIKSRLLASNPVCGVF